MEQKESDMPKYDSYDSPWKEAIEEYLPEFLALFFAHIAQEIEWEKGYEFLDKELQKVVREAESKERSVDKLVKVWRKPVDGRSKETWVFIHIDVQSVRKPHFDQRMLIYNYRLFDRYLQPIATLVILGDNDRSWHPKQYSHEVWGCELRLKFPTVKLLDYQTPQKWAELEQSKNPFAVVVMAHLYTKQTKHKPNERFDLKWRLVRMLYERGYSKQDVLSLFRFIDWMMALPPELEQKLERKMIAYEEEQKVPYITSIERIGMQRGLQQGRLGTFHKNLTTVIQTRFGNVPVDITQAINAVKQESKLDQLFQYALLAESLPNFEQKLVEVAGQS